MNSLAPQRLVGKPTILGEGMTIVRTLPTVQRRSIGAWCFLDHFGPVDVSAGRGMRVGPHPHIGLQTVSWLLEGEILHRDSLGYVQNICPGQLNLMTSGRGISHSEESPDGRPARLHGAQMWIALPDSARQGEPAFAHHAELPVLQHEGLQVTVLLGEMLGQASPGRIFTPLVGAELRSPAAVDCRLPLDPAFEYGIQVLTGELTADGEALTAGTLLYLPPGGGHLQLQSSGPVCALLLGGEPLPEQLLMWWNFVARSKDELTTACRDWNAAADYFGSVQDYDGDRLSAPMTPWAEQGRRPT